MHLTAHTAPPGAKCVECRKGISAGELHFRLYFATRGFTPDDYCVTCSHRAAFYSGALAWQRPEWRLYLAEIKRAREARGNGV